ncbi:bifunctional diaminohydroxyphosphoribosylaminopyrimidine deaminase/5-amino-6-(5-phosphoribosylamino)uracil reductase RibD [bacterium]|nr:bifunctional diaminohydroxyphosphoribosylaminopyrimidine deaminase/5-amino-6-(5-phosphoribosylamino)uracil reductase RibD [bacterium]
MTLALSLAEKGKGMVSPNPLVGAVVVKDDRILGQGYHARYGDMHAEVKALQDAGTDARGGTLYINLEPCCHHGKTPPCVDEIIKAGIARAVISMNDPNPLVNGKSVDILKKNGIEVRMGVLEKAACKLNEFFLKYITTKTPFVILKSGMSLDGKVATKSGDSKWVTSEHSRKFVHLLRNQIDATLVGIETILRDDPQLTTRLAGVHGRDPKRVVIDSLLRVPLKARIFTQGSKAENIIVSTTYNSTSERIKTLKAAGARLLFVKPRDKNRVDLQDMIRELGKLHITSLLIEGGPGINASAMQEGIVDKVIMFISPRIIGGKNAPGAIQGDGVARLEDSVRIYDLKTKRLGGDLMIEGYVRKALPCAWSPLGCRIK